MCRHYLVSVVTGIYLKSLEGRLIERISGKEKDQLAIDQNNQEMKYAGIIFLPCWFLFVIYSAMDTKWSEDIVLWLMGISALAAIGISYSAAWLWEWKMSPVKNWLLITPAIRHKDRFRPREILAYMDCFGN
jgi:hypothetical protein